MMRKRVVSRVVWWLLIVFVLFSSISVQAQSDQLGQWTTLTTLPFFPVHNHLLPTGKVMIWPGDAGISGNDPRLWNPADESVTTLAKPGYDLFCSGHAFLADGRLFVAGGHIQNGVGLPNASLYDPFSNTWAAAPDMNAGRWYPTVTTLANGDALVVSGYVDTTVGVNTLPQVYETANGTWRNLTSAQLSQDLYPMMFLGTNGKVFLAGPTQITRYLDTSGTGAWSFVADRAISVYRDYGSAVMYADGKILVLGGGDPPTNTAEVIDLNQPSPTWRAVAPMSIARRHLNATLLPDGTVLVTGGTSGPGHNDATKPVYPAELWDPATESWRTLASATVPRLYPL
jgi:Kelch motif/Galactose oxidase, central domain